MGDSNDKVFVSAVDGWLAAVLMLLPVAVIGVTIGLYTSKPDQAWVGFIAVGVVVFILGGLVFPMKYTVTASELKVAAGLFLRVTIPLADITSVTPSNNPLSSPALSLKRLRIDYGDKGKWILLSPKDRAGFLAAVAAGSGLPQSGETLGPRA